MCIQGKELNGINQTPRWWIFKWNPIGYITIYIKIFTSTKEEAWNLIPILFDKHYKHNEFSLNDFSLLKVYDEFDDCYVDIPEMKP